MKIVAELRRALDVSAYSKHPKIKSRFNDQYNVKVALALHIGQAIEGTIGSEVYKVDAAYISIH